MGLQFHFRGHEIIGFCEKISLTQIQLLSFLFLIIIKNVLDNSNGEYFVIAGWVSFFLPGAIILQIKGKEMAHIFSADLFICELMSSQ